MLKPAILSLKPKRMLLAALLPMLVSGCGIELTPGDAALCGPEFSTAIDEHVDIQLRGGMTDAQAISTDKVVSMYDAGCRRR